MFDFLKKWLTPSNEAEIKKLQKTVDEISAQEPALQALSDAGLQEKTAQFRERLAKGETLDDLLVEAYAVVRETAVRTIGERTFDTQMMGGILLHQGRIAELKTGEGKTQMCALPAYLNALAGQGVHVVTVNDYLAKFHSEWMGKIYRFLGLSVGLITHDLSSAERKVAYGADITYGTNNEYGFDYLRDNMVIYREDMVQRDPHFAIVDEVDSILIDEARTPLIISGQGEKSTELYSRADACVAHLKEGWEEKIEDEKHNLITVYRTKDGKDADYVKDEKQHTVNLTEEGTHRVEKYFAIENLADAENTEINHHILQALKAHSLMKRDVDYVVQNDEIIIVDEFTGRLMTGRRYSDGLHQAIEAKERVKVERESKTLATITFQNYFRMYKKLSGMTGTAKTEEDEFRGIYKLDVVEVPPNRPNIRKDLNDHIYRSEKGKFLAAVEEIIAEHEKGRPVLVGTVSVEKSEIMSSLLKQRGVPHEVLNAKQHEKEADIVAQAGKYGQVTIATNMAGRGTDIRLGGNAEFMARHEMKRKGYEEEIIEEAIGHSEHVTEDVKAAREVFQMLFDTYRKQTDAEHERVVSVGGLHIVGTERHESRRIDNQLRGRAGRQGDPGSTRFYISLEDELMRLFGSERILPMVDRLGLEEDQPIEYGILSKQIENAQKRVEGRNFDIRKHVLQYDDVMNKQREVIYAQRRGVLMGEDLKGNMLSMLETLVEESIAVYCAPEGHPEDWDMAGLIASLERICLPKDSISYTEDEQYSLNRETIKNDVLTRAKELYEQREAEATKAGVSLREIERVILLRVVDQKWMDHLDAMDQLRDGIGLRAYGHKDPVVEYKFEGFEMFEEMIKNIQEETISMLYHMRFEQPVARRQVAKEMRATHGGGGEASTEGRKPARAAEKVGRNAPCPCGSGKKYKNCHGQA